MFRRKKIWDDMNGFHVLSWTGRQRGWKDYDSGPRARLRGNAWGIGAEPYTKIVEELLQMRRETVQRERQAVSEGRRAYVLVNNRTEGKCALDGAGTLPDAFKRIKARPRFGAEPFTSDCVMVALHAHGGGCVCTGLSARSLPAVSLVTELNSVGCQLSEI
jgi:hypothetical protein